MDLLYCFKIEDPSGEFEPGTELLDALFLDYSSFYERESRRIWHTVYASTREEADSLRDKVVAMSDEWKELGVDFETGDVFELHKSEWADAWKKYFTPVEISDNLLINPAWMPPAPKAGQKVLSIDTGMSFGTGQHPTTFYCLKKIDQFASGGGAMLDAGCGSGILAAAAALLGYDVVDAFDFDPEAVRMSAENFTLNKVSEKIGLSVGDAGVYPGRAEKYDLVCANILGHLLITFRFNIVKWLKPDAHLVLAGILEKDFDRVSDAFAEAGLVELERETIREWTGGVFRLAK